MARTVTPSTGGSPLDNPIDINRVRNLDPYTAQVLRTDWAPSKPEFGGGFQLVIDFELPQVGGQVRDYLGLALGQQRSGQVAKLRRLLNAIAGVPETTEISFFDPETLEWGYEGLEGAAYAALEPGWQVTVRGKIAIRNDGQGSIFNITEYEPYQEPVQVSAAVQPPAAAPVAAPAPTPQPATAAAPPRRPPATNGAPAAAPRQPQLRPPPRQEAQVGEEAPF